MTGILYAYCEIRTFLLLLFVIVYCCVVCEREFKKRLTLCLPRLLLKHRADQHIEDESGIKPLSIAVKEANADIVTL